MAYLSQIPQKRCVWCNKNQAGRASSWFRFLWAVLVVAAFGPMALPFYPWKAALIQLLLAGLILFLLFPWGALALMHPALTVTWLFGIVVAGCCTYPQASPQPL